MNFKLKGNFQLHKKLKKILQERLHVNKRIFWFCFDFIWTTPTAIFNFQKSFLHAWEQFS